MFQIEERRALPPTWGRLVFVSRSEHWAVSRDERGPLPEPTAFSLLTIGTPGVLILRRKR
ncbi:MAG: PEP-CTERM sorting domain-containing protein [Chthoniobacterales bacterium]